MALTQTRRRWIAWNLQQRWSLAQFPAFAFWEGWNSWIGCRVCDSKGPAAPCWGKTECHGFDNGCGCNACLAQAQSNIALTAAQSIMAAPLVMEAAHDRLE